MENQTAPQETESVEMIPQQLIVDAACAEAEKHGLSILIVVTGDYKADPSHLETVGNVYGKKGALINALSAAMEHSTDLQNVVIHALVH